MAKDPSPRPASGLPLAKWSMASGMVPCHPHAMCKAIMPENACDAKGCDRHGTAYRCAEGCDFDVCRNCWVKLASSITAFHAHPLCSDERPDNFCDARDCENKGTSFRCTEGCDFDVCHLCFQASSKGTSAPVEVALDQDSALAVVRCEAELRLGEAYLEKTRPYIQAGQCPPVELDQKVQEKALTQMGYNAHPSTVEAYQSLVRAFPPSLRRQIFFLNANDRFFHPEIAAVGMSLLSGDLVLPDGSSFKLGSWLAQAKDKGCSKIFVMASTST